MNYQIMFQMQGHLEIPLYCDLWDRDTGLGRCCEQEDNLISETYRCRTIGLNSKIAGHAREAMVWTISVFIDFDFRYKKVIVRLRLSAT